MRRSTLLLGLLTLVWFTQIGSTKAAVSCDLPRQTVQSCIDSLPETGGTALLPAGKFDVPSTIQLTRNNVDLVGAGMLSTILVFTGPGDGVHVGNGKAPTARYSRISSMAISKPAAQGAGGIGILIDLQGASYGLTLERIAVGGGGWNTGIQAQNTTTWSLVDSIIGGIKQNGIALISVHGSSVTSTTIERNHIYENGGAGIYIELAESIWIMNNTFETNKGGAVDILRCDACLLMGNHVEFNRPFGVRSSPKDSTGSKQLSVIGNLFWNNDLGLDLSRASGGLIEGNWFGGHDTASIRGDSASSNVSYQGNTSTDKHEFFGGRPANLK